MRATSSAPTPFGGACVANISKIPLGDTLSACISRWLYAVKRPSVKSATFNRLLVSYNLLRGYTLASVRLVDLHTADIQAYVNALAGNGYSASTVKKAFNLVSGFLAYAIADGAPLAPVYLNVKLPTQAIHKAPRDVSAFSDDEQGRIRAACSAADTPAARAIILLLETGVRIGELQALQWTDVDFRRRAATIRRTLINPNSRLKARVQDSPKTTNSIRTIPLSSRALALLREMAGAGEPAGFVISDVPDFSRPVMYNQLLHGTQSIFAAAGVTWRGFHALRHTFATNCFYRGCDVKRLSKMLGHGSVTVTYNTYINLFGDALEDLRALVD